VAASINRGTCHATQYLVGESLSEVLFTVYLGRWESWLVRRDLRRVVYPCLFQVVRHMRKQEKKKEGSGPFLLDKGNGKETVRKR